MEAQTNKMLRQLFLSPGHNFFGRRERPPGKHPLIETPKIRCLADRGGLRARMLTDGILSVNS